MVVQHRRHAREYTPRDGDTLQTIAERESQNGNAITADQIALFNWGTQDPGMIEELLRDELGCYQRGEDGRFVISADCEVREPLLIPLAFDQDDLAVNRTHILTVRRNEAPPPQLRSCARVDGVNFEFDRSFIRPSVVGELKRLDDELKKFPTGKVMIFGHTDKVGTEAYNKRLSERRARSTYAFITNDADAWEDLYQEEDWGLKTVQELLRDLGHPRYDPGTPDGIMGPNTRDALTRYQEDNAARGLTVNGRNDVPTRRALFTDYMTGKHDLDLDAGRFMDPRHMGCGEFNPIERTAGRSEKNRRVTFYIFNEDRLPRLPCKYHADDSAMTPCMRRVDSSVDDKTFPCSFYHTIARNCKCEGGTPIITVSIVAEDGGKAPRAVPLEKSVKLKAQPSFGEGQYQWSTTSTRLKLENTTQQVVTVTGLKQPSDKPLAEQVQVIFTPAGLGALAPVQHKIGVCKVTYAQSANHTWGYDVYEEIAGEENDIDPATNSNKKTKEKPDPKMDCISVKKGETGKVTVKLQGVLPADVFFVSRKVGVFEPGAKQPDANPYELDLKGKAVRKAEGDLEARVNSDKGPSAGELRVVVLKEASYKVQWFSVRDSKSAGTSLTTKVHGRNDVEQDLNRVWAQGVAKWDVMGDDSIKDVRYDLDNDGVLGLEPGTTSKEEKALKKACKSTRNRAIYIHDVQYNYYLGKSAGKDDTKITLKNYDAYYINFLANNGTYTVRDGKGNSKQVVIKSKDPARHELELTTKIGQDFDIADTPYLIFPLGGLSGNPLWVSELSPKQEIVNYAVHELGHELCGLNDLCEKKNMMFGGGGTFGRKVRHRKLKKYYDTSKTQEQWTDMNR